MDCTGKSNLVVEGRQTFNVMLPPPRQTLPSMILDRIAVMRVFETRRTDQDGMSVAATITDCLIRGEVANVAYPITQQCRQDFGTASENRTRRFQLDGRQTSEIAADTAASTRSRVDDYRCPICHFINDFMSIENTFSNPNRKSRPVSAWNLKNGLDVWAAGI